MQSCSPSSYTYKIRMGCRCYWDSDTDNYAQDIFMNVSWELKPISSFNTMVFIGHLILCGSCLWCLLLLKVHQTRIFFLFIIGLYVFYVCHIYPLPILQEMSTERHKDLMSQSSIIDQCVNSSLINKINRLLLKHILSRWLLWSSIVWMGSNYFSFWKRFLDTYYDDKRNSIDQRRVTGEVW